MSRRSALLILIAGGVVIVGIVLAYFGTERRHTHSGQRESLPANDRIARSDSSEEGSRPKETLMTDSGGSMSSRRTSRTISADPRVAELRRRLEPFLRSDCGLSRDDWLKVRRHLLTIEVELTLQAVRDLSEERMSVRPPDTDRLFEGISHLGNLGLLKAIPDWLARHVSENSDPEIRRHALQAISSIEMQMPTERLRSLVGKGPRSTSELTVIETCWNGDPAAMDVVFEVLKNGSDLRLRARAAEVLGLVAWEGAIPELEAALSELQRAAPVGEMGDEDARRELFACCRRAIESCSQAQDRKLQAVEEFLKINGWGDLDNTQVRVWLRRRGATELTLRNMLARPWAPTGSRQRLSLLYSIHLFGGSLTPDERAVLREAGVLFDP
jgi:hypothetical protein